jgi:hypothetical protein
MKPSAPGRASSSAFSVVEATCPPTKRMPTESLTRAPGIGVAVATAFL